MEIESFRLGDYSVHPDLGIVRRGEAEISVERKAMEVLACLASQPGKVLDKETIIKAVWPDTLVTDDVLTHAISHLRKVLDDGAAIGSSVRLCGKQTRESRRRRLGAGSRL